MIECIGLTGKQAIPYIKDLASLRCMVFREYPYLYDGDEEAESEYLSNYSKSEDVFLVIAKAGEQVVGVSTCMAMSHADEAFQKPFQNSTIPIEKICYFGESVLLPGFRGMGIGHRFFDLREAWSQDRQFTMNAFCAVVRAFDHPSKPESYHPHDDFWNKRGYQISRDKISKLEWKEINDPEGIHSAHELVFWTNS